MVAGIITDLRGGAGEQAVYPESLPLRCNGFRYFFEYSDYYSKNGEGSAAMKKKTEITNLLEKYKIILQVLLK